jgi:bifunctional pyridoxal-dependent enzyme with beta-cystathionase and maltose regulon repressor activities
MYYKPNTYNEFASTLNKCEKFGMKDIITDEIHYDFVDSCRRDEEKCGNKGKFFTLEENLPAKMITHFMVTKSPYALVILLSLGLGYISLKL